MHLCLAGADRAKDIELLARAGAKSVLTSFVILRKLSPAKKRERLEQLRKNFEFVMIDSGAHSFFSEAGFIATKQRKTSVGKPEDFWADYLEFLLEFHEYADAFVELDIDSIVGLPTVLSWREQALKAGFPREKYVPVFHTSQDVQVGGRCWQVWEEWASEFPYVATQGAGSTGILAGVNGQMRILGRCRKHGAKLHSFATTALEVLYKVPGFFSVDSTSWKAGSMYGSTYFLDPARGIGHFETGDLRERRHRREKVLRDLEAKGLPVPEELVTPYLEDDARAVDFVNARVWAYFETYLTEVQRRRKLDYWNQPPPELLPVVNENEICTCGSPETEGACKRHGLGRGGNKPPRQVTLSPEHKAAISEAQKGNVYALRAGQDTARVPRLRCDDCALMGKCPRYEEGAACAFDNEFAALGDMLGSRNFEGLLNFMWAKVQMDSARLSRQLLIESVALGGALTKEASGLSAQLSGDIALLGRLLGKLETGTKVDARTLNVIVAGMEEEQFTRLLEQIAGIRDLAPELLRPPNDDK